MKTLNIYEYGDKVMIEGSIHNVKVENGVHKYQIKDKKSADVLDTWYTAEELIPCPEKKAENEKKEEDKCENSTKSKKRSSTA